VINSVIELPAAIVAGHSAADRLHTVDHSEAVGANVSMVSLHFTPLEWQRVKGLFSSNPKVRTGCLPLWAVRIYLAAAAALVGHQVGKFVFQGAPELIRLAVFELWIQLDGAVRPPRPPGGGLHPGIPRNANFAGQLRESESLGRLHTPGSEATVIA